MDTQKSKEIREMLEEELKAVLEQIETVGVSSKQDPGGFVAKEGEQDSDVNDNGDQAMEMSEFGTNNVILKELEDRVGNIKKALENIENGTYGRCSVCGEEIEEDRLEALPSASTCKAHKG